MSALETEWLGQILLLQSALQLAVDEKHLCEILASGLEKLPVIEEILVCVAGHIEGNNQACRDAVLSQQVQEKASLAPFCPTSCPLKDKLPWHSIQLLASGKPVGAIFIKAPPQELSPYIPFLENTSSLAAMQLENLRYRKRLEKLNDELEKQILERTQFLKKREQVLAATLHSIGDGVVTCDRDKTITTFNPGAEKLSGFSAEQAIGRQLNEILPLQWQTEKHFTEVLSDTLIGGLAAQCPHAILHPKKRQKLFISASLAPICSDNEIFGAVLVLHDQTKSYQQQEALTISQKRLELAMDTTRSGIWEWDLLNDKVFYDQRFYHIAGYQPGDFPATIEAWQERIHPRDIQKTLDKFDDFLTAKDEAFSCTFRFRCQNDEWMWLSSQALAFSRDNTGKPIKILGTHFDINDHKLTELSLRESEERFSKAAMQNLTFTWEVDPTGVFIYLHPSVEKVLGFKAEELLHSKRFFDLHPEMDKAPFFAFTQEIIGNRRTFTHLEGQVITKSGRVIWHTTSGAPFYDPDGKWCGYRGSTTDITLLKQAQLDLIESQKTLAKTASLAQVGGWVLDSQDGLVKWTEETFRICDLPQGKLPSVEETLSWYHTDDRPLIESLIQRAFNEGLDFDIQARLISTKGTLKHLRILGMPNDSSGRRQIEGVIQDISESVEAARELNKSKALLQAAIDQSPAGILIADAPDARVTTINPTARKQLELDPETHTLELIGEEGWLNAFHEDGSPILQTDCPLYRAIERGEVTQDKEIRIVNSQGPKHYLVNAAPIFDAKGSISAGVLVLNDISMRKAAEAQRLEMERHLLHRQKLESLGVLAGGIAHDFNNLLMAIHGHTELVQGELSDLEKQNSERLQSTHQSYGAAKESISQIQSASKRAAELCTQMLAYAGKGQFQIESINLSTLVKETIPLLKTSISKRAELKLKLASKLPLIKADPSQISQVIMNLVINASESLEEKNGTIEVSCFPNSIAEKETITLVVADTGCGMTTETQRRLFDPFFTTKFTGRGLGMSAVMGILNSHNAQLSIDTELGKGTTFTIQFPANTPPASRTQLPAKLTPSRLYRRRKVLVVDDEESIRNLAVRMLKRMGIEAITAEDGNEGLRSFLKHQKHIDAVILDLTMPQMNGIEVLKAMRENNAKTLVIMASGYSQDEVLRQIPKGDENLSVISKPFSLKTLQTALFPQKD